MTAPPPLQFASLFSVPGLRPVVYRPETTVPEIVEQYIERLHTLERSARTLDSVPPLLRAFAKFYPGSIGMMTARDVKAFIDARGPLVARSKNNYLGLIRSLVHFAQRQRYLPKWWDELDGLEKWTEAPTAPGIYTPDEMARILASAYSTLIPGIACIAFAGVRTAEIQRLKWADVDFKQRMIFVRASAAKTRQRRICPVTDNLAAWLAARRGPEDRPLYEGTRKSFNTLLCRTLDRAGVTPKHNGLRHSFVSYRLAAIQDAGQVALEAGNTQAVLFKHYRALVTPEDGREWFNLWPAPASTKVIPFAPVPAFGTEANDARKTIKPLRRVFIRNLTPWQRDEIRQMTVNAALEHWRGIYATGRKPSTAKYHSQMIEQIHRHWTNLETSVTEVTEAQCVEFAGRIGHYSPSRFNSMVATLRDVIPQMACVPYRKEAIAPKAIPSLEEFERLLAALDCAARGHSGLVVRLLAFSGMQIKEASSLRWTDIRKEHIAVPAEIAYNGRSRCVPFIAGMEQVLAKLREVETFDASREGLVLPQKACTRALNYACRMAGGMHCTHTTFRHYFATRALLSGANIRAVAKWLGHTDGGSRLRRIHSRLLTGDAGPQSTAAEPGQTAGNIIALPPMNGAPALATPGGSSTPHKTIAA